MRRRRLKQKMLIFVQLRVTASLRLILLPSTVNAFTGVSILEAATSSPCDCVDSLPRVTCDGLTDSAWEAVI